MKRISFYAKGFVRSVGCVNPFFVFYNTHYKAKRFYEDVHSCVRSMLAKVHTITSGTQSGTSFAWMNQIVFVVSRFGNKENK